jgi:hypothetical protein
LNADLAILCAAHHAAAAGKNEGEAVRKLHPRSDRKAGSVFRKVVNDAALTKGLVAYCDVGGKVKLMAMRLAKVTAELKS